MGEQGHPTIQDDPLAHVTPEYLSKRGVGGSDVAAILGLHPYKTAHDVALQKWGLGEPFAESEAAQWGVKFEPIILDVYAERMNLKVVRATKDTRFQRDPQKTWRVGNIDAYVQDQKIGVDAKMVNPRQFERWGEEGTDEVPDEVMCQAQWYCDLWQFERWDIAALLGNHLSVYHIHPNPTLQALLVEAAEAFWTQYVLTKTLPPADYSYASRKAIEKLHPREQGEIRQATEDETAMVLEYGLVRQRIKRLEQEQWRLTNSLCDRIGNDVGIQHPSWGKLTWKRTKDSSKTDWEAVATSFCNEIILKEHRVEFRKIFRELFDRQIAEATKTQPGARRFLPQLKEENA